MKLSIVLVTCQIISTAGFGRNMMTMTTSANDFRSPNPVIKTAAKGMSILRPIFKAEAELQANALDIFRKIDRAGLAENILENKTKDEVLIYTYGLSPFSKEALEMLDASGYEYRNIELGAEWFLLGGEASATRVLLSRELQVRSTSLPKIFIGGECIGGCAELASLVENNELDEVVQQSRSKR